MPIWGWVCIGLVVGLVALCGLLYLLFHLYVVLPHERSQKRLAQYGETVVGRIFLANPSVYKPGPPPNFEFAFVVFTRDNDASEEHLAFLGEMIDRLEDFEPDESDPDEKKLGWALETQRTVGTVLRIPDRVTGGREVYFATPGVTRSMLPEGKLTRNYIHVRVITDGPQRDASMVEYPNAPADQRHGRRRTGDDE